MDGTLLDGEGQIPEAFWGILDGFRQAGITFAVASGRQYPALEPLFDRDPAGIAFIADNGGYIVRDNVEIVSFPLPYSAARYVVRAVRDLEATHNLGVLWSCRDAAYAERSDEAFLERALVYYPGLQVVDDLLQTQDEPIKMSILELPGITEGTAPALSGVGEGAQVVHSAHEWLDVIDPRVNKGSAVAALQRSLGVTAEQTVVFGDYLNDLEMMQPEVTRYAFAMANAHPTILDLAHAIAPANHELGAVRTMAALLGGEAVGAHEGFH